LHLSVVARFVAFDHAVAAHGHAARYGGARAVAVVAARFCRAQLTVVGSAVASLLCGTAGEPSLEATLCAAAITGADRAIVALLQTFDEAVSAHGRLA
jgi:hypothetical protein